MKFLYLVFLQLFLILSLTKETEDVFFSSDIPYENPDPNNYEVMTYKLPVKYQHISNKLQPNNRGLKQRFRQSNQSNQEGVVKKVSDWLFGSQQDGDEYDTHNFRKMHNKFQKFGIPSISGNAWQGTNAKTMFDQYNQQSRSMWPEQNQMIQPFYYQSMEKGSKLNSTGYEGNYNQNMKQFYKNKDWLNGAVFQNPNKQRIVPADDLEMKTQYIGHLPNAYEIMGQNRGCICPQGSGYICECDEVIPLPEVKTIVLPQVMPNPRVPVDNETISNINNANLVDITNTYNHIKELKINSYQKNSGFGLANYAFKQNKTDSIQNSNFAFTEKEDPPEVMGLKPANMKYGKHILGPSDRLDQQNPSKFLKYKQKSRRSYKDVDQTRYPKTLVQDARQGILSDYSAHKADKKSGAQLELEVRGRKDENEAYQLKKNRKLPSLYNNLRNEQETNEDGQKQWWYKKDANQPIKVKVDGTMPNIATPWHPHTKPIGENDPWIIHPDDAQIEQSEDCEEVKGDELQSKLRNELLNKLKKPQATKEKNSMFEVKGDQFAYVKLDPQQALDEIEKKNFYPKIDIVTTIHPDMIEQIEENSRKNMTIVQRIPKEVISHVVQQAEKEDLMYTNKYLENITTVLKQAYDNTLGDLKKQGDKFLVQKDKYPVDFVKDQQEIKTPQHSDSEWEESEEEEEETRTIRIQ